MRRDREIEDVQDMIDIIDRCEVLRLGMYDDGEIYILPMNYGYTYENGELVFYLHGAVEGKKLDVLRRYSRVGVELDCDHQLVEGKVPCQYGYKYASIVGHGTAQIIEDPGEKIEAMKILMKCISGKDFDFNERLVSIISVIKVTVSSFTGKRYPK